MRFTVMEKSQSAHCCFEATVLDTKKPTMIRDKQYADEYGGHCDAVCECFSMEEAQLIAAALNLAPQWLLRLFARRRPAPHPKPPEPKLCRR